MTYNGKWQGSVENLTEVYSLAYQEEINAGMDWYSQANTWAEVVASRFNLHVDLVIDITAAISPNNQWERNKADTVRVIEAWLDGEGDPRNIRCCTYNVNVQIALDMLDGMTHKLAGPKVTAFAHNIRHPKTIGKEVVTVDIWAFRAWIWNSRAKVTINPSMSRAAAADYTVAADQVEQYPRDFQAIVWLATRRAGGYGRAKYCGLDRLKNQISLW